MYFQIFHFQRESLLSPRDSGSAGSSSSTRRIHDVHSSPSPVASGSGLQTGRKSPVRIRMRSSASSTAGSGAHSTGSGRNLGLRQPIAVRAGSSLAAPVHHADNRRWSLASLPSTSGYGTPGSNSAFSVSNIGWIFFR